MPKRVSLPSKLPPVCRLVSVWSTPSCVSSGLPPCSTGSDDGDAGHEQDEHRRPERPALARVADHLAEHVRQTGRMAKIDSISTKLLSGVGFSNGCAELALKKPPPLVPSILIASWEATGP